MNTRLAFHLDCMVTINDLSIFIHLLFAVSIDVLKRLPGSV